MRKTQLLALFLCSLIPWTIGSGMVPLLPLYAAELGAAPAVAGNYLAISFLALAAGSVGASWLSDHLRRRKTPVIVAGLASVPALWLMGRATNIWYLTAFSATWFLLGGLAIALVNVLAGLSAEESERGRVFGLLALGQPLGSLIGGLATGPIADRWGYPTMFAVLAVFGLLWPLTGLLLTDRVAAPVRRAETVVAQKGPALGGSFTLLFLAGLAASVVTPVLILGRSLAMRDLGLPAAAISSAGAIAGAATLPLPPLLGWLSDRAGRRRCLALGYISGTAGLLCLAGSVSLWHFWVASSLVGLVMPVTLGVGSALATDVVPREAVGRAVSLFSATNWVGNVIGYASTGYAIQHLGLTPTFVIGAFMPLVAIGLLILVRVPRREESAAHLQNSGA
jgi:MFS family permease